MIPKIAQAFSELGYRRATTAELAKRCAVRENILYRHWRDKKAMFIASIDYVYQQAAEVWRQLLGACDETADTAEQLLNHEAKHYGETGMHRIILAGLSETDDPEIREALRRMYARFHSFIRGQIVAHRGGDGAAAPDATTAAWAIVALGNVSGIGRELGLLSAQARRRLMIGAGRLLLEGEET